MTPEQMVAAKWRTMRQPGDRFAVMATFPGMPVEVVVTTDCWGLSDHIAWTHNIMARGRGVTYDDSILLRPSNAIADKYRDFLETRWWSHTYSVFARVRYGEPWRDVVLTTNRNIANAIADAHNMCVNYLLPPAIHKAMQREYIDRIVDMIGNQISSW